MNLARLLVHDYDAGELAQTELLLAEALEGIDGFAVEATPSRTNLLRTIATLEPGQHCLVLVDLAANERDHVFRGLRIIETIALHPTLSRQARAAAITVYGYPPMLDQVASAGGVAVVHKRALEVPGLDLAPYLTDALKTNVPADGQERPLLHVPPQSNLAASRDPATVFAELFPGLPYSFNRAEFLRGQHAGLHRKTMAQRANLKPKAIESIRTELGRHAHPRFRRGDNGVALGEAAEEFFENCPDLRDAVIRPAGPPEGLPADFERLPRPEHIGEQWATWETLKAAWLDPEAEAALTRTMSSPGETWTERIDGVVPPPRDRHAFDRAVTRAVYGLIDADADLRRHEPERLG